MTKYNRSQGFSLIELLIALVIIGILSGVAYPSYEEFLRQTRRADAMAQLVELTLEMEQFRSSTNSYEGAATGGGDIGVPDENLLMALDENIGNYYDIIIFAASRDSYMLQATPKNVQDDDVCGVITIGMNGDFNYAPLDGSLAPDSCEK